MPSKPQDQRGRDEAAAPAPKTGLHPRNRHRGGYDFAALAAAWPRLAAHVLRAPHGGPSIDFADPRAVKCLNQALLLADYRIRHWDLPDGFLCPPIPGRADYLHHAADLLAGDAGGVIPRGPSVRVLDLGVGANCVYPILGHQDYGWSFVGSDTDPASLEWADGLVARNAPLRGHVELRRQHDRSRLLEGVLRPDERFALCVCNPPFHASPAEAAAASGRKVRNLTGRRPAANAALNFGGRANELWCPGGERGFLLRLIAESRAHPRACTWFSTLVSRSENLPALLAALKASGAPRVRVIPMAQGQKKSRILAWSHSA